MSRQSLRCATLAALFVATTAAMPRASAQTTGTISGRVVFEAGGYAVHGAAIVLVSARRTAVTGEDGKFELANVPPGTYDLLAQREHFTAARQTVTVVAGQTVTVEFVLAITGVHEEVTVTGTASGAATTFESFSSVTSLDSVELAKDRGATITDALANQPGIAIRSFGPGSARPIIRGFDGDRVLIMQDGVRTGDLSSQSGDHGVTIDPAGLERLEVVKGPATLLYGSNAIGGVVNAITPQDAFRASPFDGLLGGVSIDAGSANAQGGASANVQYGRGPWTVWGGGGGRRTGDYDSPSGTIPNSATRLRNGKAGVGWVGARAFAGLGVQIERSRFGVPFAGELHGHEDADGGEAESDEDAPEIDLRSNRDEVRVDAGLRSLTNRWIDSVKLTAARTSYRHDEIETANGIDTVGTRFDNDLGSLRLELEQKQVGRWHGRIGMDWFGRDYRASGEEALAPPTTQSAVSGFVYEEVAFDRVRLQLGARVERNAYDVSPRDIAPETIDEHGAPPAVRDRTFTGGSASFGVHADIGAAGAFVANVTSSSRAPALEELYNFGPHVGNLAFEIGNPDLGLERTLGFDMSLRGRSPAASGEVTVYTYGIRNFVFLDVTGNVIDGLREANVLQGDSRFVGAEAKADVRLAGGVRLNGGFSVVRARLTTTDEDLPRIPPVSGRLELEVPWRGITFSPEVVFTAAQREVFRDETTSGSYELFNISATYFVARGHATHAVAVSGHNLTNREYRMHTSFLKDFAPEMGRSVKVTYTVRFF